MLRPAFSSLEKFSGVRKVCFRRSFRIAAQEGHGGCNTGDHDGHHSVRDVLRPCAANVQEFCRAGRRQNKECTNGTRQNVDTIMESVLVHAVSSLTLVPPNNTCM